MKQVETLIVGAGVTGLAAAGQLGIQDYLVIEADTTIGGYCKTIERSGFVWDYSGHFFHFRNPSVDRWLRERMRPEVVVSTVRKKAFVAYGGRMLDYPFQKSIHQLPREEFLECLHDLYFAERQTAQEPSREPRRTLREMLEARYGRGICEKFLFPYNEKVYACNLDELDPGAMGRFFPAPSLADIIRHFRDARDDSYNATFSYPSSGAIAYVDALASAVRPDSLSMEEGLVSVDRTRRVAMTTRREIGFGRMISTLPLPLLAALSGLEHDPGAFSWSKVLVFNFGFDAKGPRDVHWVYFPSPDVSFYRVGFYDNILGTDRMSLYVEVAMSRTAVPERERLRSRVLSDLRAAGVVSGQRLVAEHSVMLDPAYVHISKRAEAERERVRALLEEQSIYSAGRYGAWRYCSIEDNIVEAWELVRRLRGGAGTA